MAVMRLGSLGCTAMTTAKGTDTPTGVGRTPVQLLVAVWRWACTLMTVQAQRGGVT